MVTVPKENRAIPKRGFILPRCWLSNTEIQTEKSLLEAATKNISEVSIKRFVKD